MFASSSFSVPSSPTKLQDSLQQPHEPSPTSTVEQVAKAAMEPDTDHARLEVRSFVALELSDLWSSPLPMDSPASSEGEENQPFILSRAKRSTQSSIGRNPKRQVINLGAEQVHSSAKEYLITEPQDGIPTTFFHYKGEKYALENPNRRGGYLAGVNHHVRTFADKIDLEFPNSDGTIEIVNTGNLVLKVWNPSSSGAQKLSRERPDENGLKSMDRDDIAGYEAVKKAGIPLLRCYGMPPELLDWKRGGIWLLEKLSAEVKPLLDAIVNATSVDDLPEPSRKLIDYAKFWIEAIARKAATTGEELIGDFRPANVMIRYIYDDQDPEVIIDEEFVVVDFAKPRNQLSVKDFIKCIKQWAGHFHKLPITAPASSSSSSSTPSMPIPNIVGDTPPNQVIYDYLIDKKDIDGKGGALIDYLEERRTFPALASSLLHRDVIRKCTDINNLKGIEKALIDHIKKWVKDASECLKVGLEIEDLDLKNIAVRTLYDFEGNTIGYECFERDPKATKQPLSGQNLNKRINEWSANNPVIKNYCIDDSSLSDD
ncbi:MAG: hypothetical protein E6Q59_06555 [Nitrosomonas sp.]|nr:MAG: hypothetical protein E6Q59_06555 [Nitrosomonas sp.]